MDINQEVLDYFQDNILTEARVKDVKAKYPVLNNSGWINWARRQIEDNLGPKGVSKYLMYWAKAMHDQFGPEEDDDYSAENIKNSEDVLEIGNVVLDLIFKFQRNQARMEEKDIYKYNIAQLQNAMEKLGLSSREKKKKKKEQAIEGSEIVYEDNDMFAVRPYTEKASCYYGERTRWCISATQSRNYFGQYTEDGRAFVMVRMENLPDSHEYKKIALVFDSGGNFEEAYNAPDDSIDEYDVQDAIALNHKRTGMNSYHELDEEEQQEISDIFQELMDAASNNVMDNPPDPTENYEERIEEIEEEYRGRITHAYYNADIDHDGNQNYLFFGGGFQVEIDNSKFEGGEYAMPSGWREESVLTGAIDRRLQDINVYVDEVTIEDYGGTTTFDIRIPANDYEPSPDGYDRFLSDLREYDEKYNAIVRVIEKYLAEEQYIGPIEFDRFKAEDLEKFGASLKNFTYHVEEEVGDETISFTSEIMALPAYRAEGVLRVIPDIERWQQYTSMAAGYQKYTSKTVVDKVTVKIKDLHQKVVRYLDKQLELPISDLPPRVVKELTVPELLNVVLLVHPEEDLKFLVDLEINDVKVTPEVTKAVMDIIKFIDSNFFRIEKAISETIEEVFQAQIRDANRKLEMLQPHNQEIIKLAQKAQYENREIGALMYTVNNYLYGRYGVNISLGELAASLSKIQRELFTMGKFPQYDSLEDMPLVTAQTLEEGTQLPKNCFVQILNETNASIERYFSGAINEESERSRQKGIYRFWCMLGYSLDTERGRGLDDILAEIRAIPSVTIVTVAVRNRKIGDNLYIAGLSIKFVPSYPGTFISPEDAKSKILTSIRKVSGVNRIFKISTSFERVE